MTNSTGVRLIFEYDKLLVFVNLGFYSGPSPTPREYDCKSISKDWFAKTCLFLCQLYYFTCSKCTGVYSDTRWWDVSPQRFRTHPIHIRVRLYKCLNGIAPKAMNLHRSVSVIEDSRCVQRLEDSLMYHIQRRQRIGEELSRSLVDQHGTHCQTILKTAA